MDNFNKIDELFSSKQLSKTPLLNSINKHMFENEKMKKDNLNHFVDPQPNIYPQNNLNHIRASSVDNNNNYKNNIFHQQGGAGFNPMMNQMSPMMGQMNPMMGQMNPMMNPMMGGYPYQHGFNPMMSQMNPMNAYQNQFPPSFNDNYVDIEFEAYDDKHNIHNLSSKFHNLKMKYKKKISN